MTSCRSDSISCARAQTSSLPKGRREQNPASRHMLLLEVDHLPRLVAANRLLAEAPTCKILSSKAIASMSCGSLDDTASRSTSLSIEKLAVKRTTLLSSLVVGEKEAVMVEDKMPFPLLVHQSDDCSDTDEETEMDGCLWPTIAPKISKSSSCDDSQSNSDPASSQSPPPPHLIRCPPARSILRTVSSYGSDGSTTSSPAEHGGLSSSANKPRLRRNVSFASVGIREYSQTLGDHPNVSYGPPLSLDWDYNGEIKLDFEVYEAERPPRRSLRGMMQNYYQRRDILSHYGHTEEELKRSKKRINKAKMERSVTRYFLPVQHIEDALTSAGRKAKRLVSKEIKDERAKEKEYLRSSLSLSSSFSSQFSTTPPYPSRRSSA